MAAHRPSQNDQIVGRRPKHQQSAATHKKQSQQHVPQPTLPRNRANPKMSSATTKKFGFPHIGHKQQSIQEINEQNLLQFDENERIGNIEDFYELNKS